MPVLPSPGLVGADRPAPTSVWARISPSTYDSVNRFEPTTSAAGSARAVVTAPSTSATIARRAAPASRTVLTRRSALLGPRARRASWTLMRPVFPKSAHSSPSIATESSAAATSPEAQPSRSGAGRPMSPLKAFIVEDSPVIRENLVAALEEMAPIEVVGTAEDESSAISWLKDAQHRCDLVVVDIFLKSGSGLGVL